MNLRTCCKQCCVGGLGLVLTVIGMTFYFNWVQWFTTLRGQEMALHPNSSTYSSWKSSPMLLNFDIFLFNWTNPHEITNHSIKPHFQELGPYRYTETLEKTDVTFHPHNHSVSYRMRSIFHFDPAGSVGKLDDVVTTVNLVAWTAAHKIRNSGYFEKQSLKTLLNFYHEEVSVTKTADELLFKGYQDPLLDIANVAMVISNGVSYDRIGFFYNRNMSTNINGYLNTYTGSDNIEKLGKIHTWDAKTHTGFFDSHCGMVNGSAGDFFPPNLKETYIEMYPPNICRTLRLDYTETVDIHGVKGLKFSGSRRSVDNGSTYPESRCFCHKDQCEPAGVMTLAPCQHETTTFMSYPHFYNADPIYLEQIDGLKPNKSKHEFFMTLEPYSGLPLDVAGGLQVNILIEPISKLGIYEKVPRVLLPLMWCGERFSVTPDIAANINIIPMVSYWGQVIASIMTVIGLILLFWYPAQWIKLQCTPKDQRKPVVQKEYELKAINPETKSFVEKNDVKTLIVRPQELSLLGKSSGEIKR